MPSLYVLCGSICLNLLSILQKLGCFLIEFIEFLIHSRYVLYQISYLQIFHPIYGSSFHLFQSGFQKAEIINFDESKFVEKHHGLGVSSKEGLPSKDAINFSCFLLEVLQL